jgi:ABC-type phosphate transport system permease subunit
MRYVFALGIASGLMLSSLSVAAGETAPCTCRAPGHTYNLGDEACLQTPQGPRTATCIMTLNVTSWDFSKTPCNISLRDFAKSTVG